MERIDFASHEAAKGNILNNFTLKGHGITWIAFEGRKLLIHWIVSTLIKDMGKTWVVNERKKIREH